MEGIEQIDRIVTLWLNNLPGAWMDPFWALMSHIRIWFPFYALFMLYALWKLGWKRGLAVVLSIVITIVCIDQFANLIKVSLGRLRPCYDAWMINNGLRLPYGMQEYYKFGFFSAHAANSFGFAAVSYLGLKWNKPQSDFRPWGWFVFIWASCMSISRVMMGAHFLGDVLVGVLVGLFLGWLWAKIARQIVVKAKL